MLSLAPPTIPLLTQDYGQSQASDENSTEYVSYADTTNRGLATNGPTSSGMWLRAVGGEVDPYPSKDSLRPISPEPSWPGVPSGSPPIYSPLPGDETSPQYPESPEYGDLIDIGKSNELQSAPLDAIQPAADNSEAREVLDMLGALNYVPNRQAAKVQSEPTLTPSRLNDAGTDSPPALDALGRTRIKDAPDGEGIVLKRQPLVGSTAIDEALSAAAIDALLEMPAKIEGVQSKFQAFEVSAGSDVPLPIAPLHREPAQTDSRPGLPDLGATTAPDLIRRDAFLAATTNSTNPTAPEMATDMALPPPIALPANVEHAAIDSQRQLDVISATLAAALIGRAVWKIRTEGIDARDDSTASSKISPSPTRQQRRLRFEWLTPHWR